MSQLSLNYRESPLSVADSKLGEIHAGDRIPDLSLLELSKFVFIEADSTNLAVARSLIADLDLCLRASALRPCNAVFLRLSPGRSQNKELKVVLKERYADDTTWCRKPIPDWSFGEAQLYQI